MASGVCRVLQSSVLDCLSLDRFAFDEGCPARDRHRPASDKAGGYLLIVIVYRSPKGGTSRTKQDPAKAIIVQEIIVQEVQ
jgi:hypothetical protein